MKECGVYLVTGVRDYRGHVEGTEFVALIDPKAERRAVERGAIERIGTMVPRPQDFVLPRGWLEGNASDEERGI